MRAIVLNAVGGTEGFELKDVPFPKPGPGEIRVRNAAIGVNFIDIYQRTGLYPIAVPAILGSDGAGVVTEAGEGAPFAVGQRVAYYSGAGAYAEEIALPASRAAAIPDAISDEIASAAFLKGLTVAMLVRDVHSLRRGETALVTAAAGGVGLLLCQWANHIGARVIAVVGSEAKVDAARSAGAETVIVRSQTDDLAGAVRAVTNGRGVDVAYDSVGAATFGPCLDSLALRGLMVTFGNASGPVPAIAPLELTRRGSLGLRRPSLMHYATPERMPAMAAALWEVISSGAVAPKIAARLKLAEVAEAHRALEGGASIGAIVLTP